MKKFFKAFGFILLYWLVYSLIQYLTLVIFVVLTPGLDLNSQNIADCFVENTGYVFIMSAALSFSAFSAIYALRGKNILSESNLTNGVSLGSLVCGGMFGLSANFVVSTLIAALMQTGVFDSVFERYDSLMSAIIKDESFIPILIGMGIIVPIVEEVMFRGIISRELDSLFSPKIVLVFQGALFGIYHMNVVQGSYAALLGIFFGFMVYKTNSVWPAIAAHIFMNSSSVFLAQPQVVEFYEKYAVSILLAITILFFSSIRHFIKLPPPNEHASV